MKTGLLVLLLGQAALGQWDERVLRLIPPEASVVVGMNLERYRQTALSKLMPAGSSSGHRMVMEVPDLQGPAGIAIYQGTLESEREEQTPLLQLRDGLWVGGSVELLGTVRERWQADGALQGAALRAKEMAERFDCWVLMREPLRAIGQGVSGAGKHRMAMLGAIVEVRAGVRLGAGSHEVTVEVDTASAEDAAALATLARWLPGLLQLRGGQDALVRLVDAVENLRTGTAGTTAYLTFTLPDTAAEQPEAGVL